MGDMTISEFKAFLDGMNLGECPTPEQWARIQEKIAALKEVRLQYEQYRAPMWPASPPITCAEPITGILPYSTCVSSTKAS